MNLLRYIAISFMSGITAIIPGVSGGTIFAIFGISEPLAESINKLVDGIFTNLTKPKAILDTVWKYAKLPAIIGLGSLFSSIFYANLLLTYGSYIESLLRFLFIGLVIFSLPTLWSETKNENEDKKYKKYVYFIIGFLFALILFNAEDSVINPDMTNFNSPTYLFTLFAVSLIGGITTILPGISGTNILIIGGVFNDYIMFSADIASYPLQYGTYLIATIIGSVIAAKFFSLLFKKYRYGFFSLMTGLTASTIVFIWGNPFDNILQSIIGLLIAYGLIKTLNVKQ